MNFKDDEVRINISKTKTIIQTIIAVGLLMTLIWFVIFVFTLSSTLNRTFLIICCSFLVIISLFAIITSVKRLMNCQGIILNNEGIEINTGPNNGHVVKWDDITNLKIHNPIRGPMFLLIFVKNPDYYISHSYGIKRFILRMNNISRKTPVSLTSNWLDCNFETLVALVTENHKKFKGLRNNKTTTA